MKNFEITWEDFPRPCYSPQDRYGDCPKTFVDLLNVVGIPTEDLIWAFSVCPKISDREKRLFAVRCARETPIDEGRMTGELITDPRSISALDVAERFANGAATSEELAAARAAARAAAWAAARAAAWAAAWAAARAAAWDAAWDAARDAAGAAAGAAARDAEGDAARAAARDAQIQFIKDIFKG